MLRRSAALVLLGFLLAACAPTVPPQSASAPAAKPAAASAAATPAAPPSASPAGFDERAVADFYRGKTIRLVLGLPAGTGADTGHRLIAKYMTRYLPGNPRIIVENKPGAGGILATNLVYNVEPQDGTVISAFVESNVLQQALGAPGIEFDAGKLQWLGSAVKTTGACLARTDTGITSIQDTIAGPEVIIGVSAPGGTTHDVAAVLKAALGANFRLVMGYDGSPRLILATESKEVEGFCVSLRSMLSDAAHLLEGETPIARIIAVQGSTTPDHPLLKGIPAAETLARTEEAKLLLRAQNAPLQMNTPSAVAPGVPADRVQALRWALAQTLADPQFLDEAQRAKMDVNPTSGEEVARLVQGLLNTPPDTLAKLKDILK